MEQQPRQMNRYVVVLILAVLSPLLFAAVSNARRWGYDWRHGVVIAVTLAVWVALDATERRVPDRARWVFLAYLVVCLWAVYLGSATVLRNLFT